MKQLLKRLATGVTVAGVLSSTASFAQEQSVKLHSMDKTFEVTGELISASDEYYTLRTAVGDIEVPRKGVECVGDACPQKSTDVILTSGDGTSFNGKLLGYDGTSYILQTKVGVLTIRGEFVNCSGGTCPSETREKEASTEIVLRSGDGTIFSGKLLGYDGTTYELETKLGVLNINGNFVQCKGEACPNTGPVVSRFTIASPPDEGEEFIGEALKRFVDEKSLNLTRSMLAGGNIQFLIGSSDGALVADITVVPANDASSIDSLFANKAAFALTREALSANIELLDSRPVALDALVAHIHPENRVDSISLGQMAGILSGNITNWAQVGGDDAAIELHVLGADNNLSKQIERDLLVPQRVRLASFATAHETPEQMAEIIRGKKNAFAVSYRSSGHGTKIPTTRNNCNMFSNANAFSLQTEEYPLTMTWNLYKRKGIDIPDVAVSLADYLISDQGQAAARKVGLIDLAIDKQPMSAQGERLLSAMLAESVTSREFNAYRDYLAEVSSATRLSTTLRFVSGTSELDERSVSDIRRISNLISSGVLTRDNLMLVGFSDSVGRFDVNINLSNARARVVKTLLMQDNIGRLDAKDILTFGFGPVAPVGCNNTVEGKSLNRRVEVWLRGTNQEKLR